MLTQKVTLRIVGGNLLLPTPNQFYLLNRQMQPLQLPLLNQTTRKHLKIKEVTL